MKYSRYFLWLLLLVHPLLHGAITVSIDRNPVHANESFQLFFDADEAPDDDPDFSPLQKDFAILNTSQNSSISIINGNYQRNIKWTLQLMARQAGVYEIPEIHFGRDKTDRFHIDVKPAAAPSDTSGRNLIFELSADRDTASVQEQIIVTMRLLSSVNISAYEFGDLVVDNIEVVTEPLGDVRRYQTKIAGKDYLVLEQKVGLFPQNSGDLLIKPVLGQVRLASASKSVFDPFQRRGEIRSVYSSDLKLTVSGINAAYSGKHWLPATDVRLVDEWHDDLDHLVAGEPVTRTITLVAEGLTAAQLPMVEQAQVDGIRQYPDQPIYDDRRGDSGITGMRQQKVALIVNEGGQYTIPEIRLAWWNRESGRAEVATLPSRVITVAAAPETPQAVSTAPDSPVQDSSTVRPTPPPSSNRFWVWLSLFLACGWMSNAIYWWWRHRQSARAQVDSTPPQLALKKASRLLQQACQQNNAASAREALMVWARALPVDKDFTHLNEISLYFGNPLKSQIDEMNQSLYSASKQSWQGQQLWQTCFGIAESMATSESFNTQSLPALNP